MKYKFNIILKLKVFALLFFVSQVSYSLPINNYIDNVNPQMNAVSASKNSDIQIVFVQQMNASSLINSNIKVFGYKTGLLDILLSYNSLTRTLQIDPAQDFKYGEIISITLTAGISTSGGESISPFVYSFTTQTTGGNGIFLRSSGVGNIAGEFLKTGDIDRDGDIDLVVDNKIYKNNGMAIFTFFEELSHTGIPELADFDSDGYLDIVLQDGSIIYFYKNGGTGSFIPIYTRIGGVGSFGDLNGDGFLDISYYSTVTNVSVLKNNNGVLEPDTVFHFIVSCQNNQTNYKDNILIADYDNDGQLDLASINGEAWDILGFYYLCRNFNQMKNIGNGNYVTNLFFSDLVGLTSAVIYDLKDSRSFDYNNDGLIDIFTPDKRITNNGNGSFTVNYSIIFSNTSISDFNGDGFLDVVSNFTFSPLYTDLNDGQGNFTQIMGNPSNFTALAEGDFDNEGDIDIVAADPNANETAILINSDIPSPVELSSFTSSVSSNNVDLYWTTAFEENNSGFDIERIDTKNIWKKVGFVSGIGSSNVFHDYNYTDKNLLSGKYRYRLKQIDYNGYYQYYNLSNDVIIASPEQASLSQNYPNPFNPKTIITYEMPVTGNLNLNVFDVLGNEVASLVNEKKTPGIYSVEFDGSNFPSGIYFYKLKIEEKIISIKRMVLIK